MKYALLARESKELLKRRNDGSLKTAGMAYGEALRAAGVMVGGAGLLEPSEAVAVG